MANFNLGKSLNVVVVGAAPTLIPNLIYKENFFIRARKANTGNITVVAGDNNIIIDELEPGERFDVTSYLVELKGALPEDVPLKINGATGDGIYGLIG